MLAALRDTVLPDNTVRPDNTVLPDNAAKARVADLGCGEGRLVAMLLREPSVARVIGVDVSHRALERAARRLHLDTMAARQRARVDLLQGSLTYGDGRLAWTPRC